VQSRLPGWRIVKADAAWEGAWTVVAACGSDGWDSRWCRATGYSWLQPADAYARSRLRSLSDYPDTWSGIQSNSSQAA
jgi:hypothetical protein